MDEDDDDVQVDANGVVLYGEVLPAGFMFGDSKYGDTYQFLGDNTAILVTVLWVSDSGPFVVVVDQDSQIRILQLLGFTPFGSDDRSSNPWPTFIPLFSGSSQQCGFLIGMDEYTPVSYHVDEVRYVGNNLT